MLTVLGEGVVDLGPAGGSDLLFPRPGGSPLNVAVGLARLGRPTTMLARFSRNAFGRRLRAHALGFWAALREVFPDTREQRDWVHKTANVLAALPKSAHPGAKAALAEIWGAD